ncbi:MAG: ABC transporter substrate-binding protein [Clostridia bacterium]|nr:ABC transporter substrate-binding protein [Clostridia bacterium]
MKKVGVLLLCMLMAISFVACDRGKTEEGSADKVRLGEVTHSVFYAPQYAAINLGFFAEEGIEIELSNLGGADKVMSALLSNQIDVGFCGPEASIYVYNEGREDYCEVFAQMTKRDGSFLVGKDNPDVFDWNQLKGKTVISGRKGGVPYMTFEYLLKEKGINPKKDLVLDDSIQFSLMAGAFSGSNAEYVTLFEPTASMIEQENKGYILASIGQESGEIPYTAYCAKKSYIGDNEDLIERFTRAVYKGLKWVNENSAEEVAKVILESFPDTDLELMTKVVQRYKDIDSWKTDPVLDETSYDKLQTVMESAGELSKKAPYDKIVNNKYANKVLN